MHFLTFDSDVFQELFLTLSAAEEILKIKQYGFI